MVIHDMRNPTNSIEFALKEVLRIISDQGTAESANPVAGGKTHSENFRLVPVLTFDSHQNLNDRPKVSPKEISQIP